MPQNPPSSICILRLSAIGDVTHVLPVINALREQWPDTEITWICGRLEYKLLSAIPGIRFIVFDKASGLRGCMDVRRQLEGERFDILLHMQVALRANLLSWFIPAERKIGWDKANSRDLHSCFIDESIATGVARHQVETFLAFADALGLESSTPRWDYPIPENAFEWARAQIDTTKPVCLISACSSHPLRNWSVENYAAVADYAIEQKGMQVILSGGPSDLERDTARAIAGKMRHAPIDLVGKDTLQQSMAMLSLVDVVISPDSGPAHMANAVGTPVIGLYACTNPERSGPYGSLQHCVNRFPEAAEKFMGKSVSEMRWGKKIEMEGVMDLITVEDVIERLEGVLAAG